MEFRPDAFDGPLPEKQGSPLESQHLRWMEILDFWHRQFAMENIPAMARVNQPALILSSYRIIREICRIKGILDDQDPLCATLGVNPNPWVSPVKALVEEIPGWEGKFPILRNKATPIYPPLQFKGALDLYYSGLKEAVQRLHLHITPSGEIGQKYLLDRDLATSGIWPEPNELFTFESRIFHKLIKAEMVGGLVEAREHLVEDGFLSWEISSLVRGARDMAIEQFSLTLEEARTMVILRCEEVIRRSRIEGREDLRAEIQAIKLMAAVLGLGRADLVNEVDGMTEIVKKVSAEEEKKKGLKNG